MFCFKIVDRLTVNRMISVRNIFSPEQSLKKKILLIFTSTGNLNFKFYILLPTTKFRCIVEVFVFVATEALLSASDTACSAINNTDGTLFTASVPSTPSTLLAIHGSLSSAVQNTHPTPFIFYRKLLW